MANSTEKNNSIFDALKPAFKGDIDYSPATLALYSHDASLFEIRPRVVIFPKDSADVQAAVRWVNKMREENAERPNPDASLATEIAKLSITARSAGTDMSGGSINSSIIMDFTRSMNRIIEVTSDHGTVQPGCFYRDFEKETLKHGVIMPTYPASREICAVGGMVANNSGGEKSIKYGKTENHIRQLKVVFTDGNEYVVKPLTESELKAKIATGEASGATDSARFEAELYKKLWNLISENYDVIMSAKPTVSKNSAGYYLWNVYDKASGRFDLCRLICGSQGTLGIHTEITFELLPVEPFSEMLIVFLPSLTHISELINEILPYQPESIESYDDYTMQFAVKFFFDFFKQLGFWGAIKLGFRFIPEAWMVLATGKIPKMIVMIEFTGKSEADIHKRLVDARAHIAHFGYKSHITRSSGETEKYWRIRRESFNLLRKHAKGKRTAPFIDDIIVEPKYLPEFLPKLQEILSHYPDLIYTIAGHPGNGNFHIIPLMDLNSPLSADIILELSKKVYTLIHEYHGSITAEHNDGIIRTPYLLQMYGDKIVALFKQTKEIFDPHYILNPGKKVGGTFDDIRKAIDGARIANTAVTK